MLDVCVCVIVESEKKLQSLFFDFTKDEESSPICNHLRQKKKELSLLNILV